jgi:nucleoside 2-deoxyribosyltransferase
VSAPKVFISYSQDDREWVRAFADALRQQQVEVWLDQWEIKAGDSLRDSLEAGLRQSDAIVAVVTSSNARSPNVFFELGAALGMGKRLIPVVSNDLETSLIPFGLRTRRYLAKGLPAETAREVASAIKEGADAGDAPS